MINHNLIFELIYSIYSHIISRQIKAEVIYFYH